jgi:hypothetical protein
VPVTVERGGGSEKLLWQHFPAAAILLGVSDAKPPIAKRYASARHLIQLVVVQFVLQGALTIALVLVHHRSPCGETGQEFSCPPAEAFRPEGFVALLLKKARACRVDLPRNTERIECGFARACASAL